MYAIKYCSAIEKKNQNTGKPTSGLNVKNMNLSREAWHRKRVARMTPCERVIERRLQAFIMVALCGGDREELLSGCCLGR